MAKSKSSSKMKTSHVVGWSIAGGVVALAAGYGLSKVFGSSSQVKANAALPPGTTGTTPGTTTTPGSVRRSLPSYATAVVPAATLKNDVLTALGMSCEQYLALPEATRKQNISNVLVTSVTANGAEILPLRYSYLDAAGVSQEGRLQVSDDLAALMTGLCTSESAAPPLQDTEVQNQILTRLGMNCTQLAALASDDASAQIQAVVADAALPIRYRFTAADGTVREDLLSTKQAVSDLVLRLCAAQLAPATSPGGRVSGRDQMNALYGVKPRALRLVSG